MQPTKTLSWCLLSRLWSGMSLKRERVMFKERGKKILEREGHKWDQRAGAPLLWRQAERAIHAGGEKVPGKLQSELSVFKGWLHEN